MVQNALVTDCVLLPQAMLETELGHFPGVYRGGNGGDARDTG